MKTLSIIIISIFTVSAFSQRMIKASNCDCLYNTGGAFTWSGRCVNGYCDGDGTIQWYDDFGRPTGKYCGSIKLGKNEGFGIQYNSDGTGKYVGYWSNDLYNGQGTLFEYKEWGRKYEGNFIDGKKSGYGKTYSENGKLLSKGYWLNDKLHGEVTLYTIFGEESYGIFNNGEFVKSIKNLTNNRGENTPTIGCVSGDCSNGYGTYIYNNGDKYEGYFRSGVRSGSGTYNYKDGSKYIGNFSYDKKNGNGSYFQGGEWTYDGVFKDGELSYKTKERTSNNSSDLKDLVTGAIIVGGAIALVSELFSSNSGSSSSNNSSYSSSMNTNNQNSSNSYNYGKFELGSKWFWVQKEAALWGRYVYCFRIIDYTATKVQFKSEGKICEKFGEGCLRLFGESWKLNPYGQWDCIDIFDGKTFWMYRSDCEKYFYTYKPDCE